MLNSECEATFRARLIQSKNLRLRVSGVYKYVERVNGDRTKKSKEEKTAGFQPYIFSKDKGRGID